MKYIGIIPARYASSRFPGKPLADIRGKSMIRRVYEQATKAKSLNIVYVATDDKRIFDHVETFGNVIYTSEEHKSGTDRCNEALNLLQNKLSLTEKDVLINVQGDEPFIDPDQINKLAEVFNNPEINIATLAKQINSPNELFDENVVKVVFNKRGKAIYFSRAAIPFCRSLHPEKWLDKYKFYKHLGIYAYRIENLKKISALKESEIEKCESLEQLRWIENGFDIYITESQTESYSIDTPNDINKLPKNPI